MQHDKPYSPYVIIGTGAAGLMAADVLSAAGHSVAVFEQMPSPARKVLMAGRGGLNLTHSEPYDRFLLRYTDAPPPLISALSAFTAADTIAWVEGLGQPVFTGSSGRVFPKAMKASPLVRSLLARLGQRGVVIKLRHNWIGFAGDGRLAFMTPDGRIEIDAPRATLLALGGGSWPRLGSDGAWTNILAEAGISIVPFSPSNCGIHIAWSEHFKQRFAGTPLKRIAVSSGGKSARGEAVITRHGLQGGVIYALSPEMRDQLGNAQPAPIKVDLLPDVRLPELTARLSKDRKKQSLATFLRKSAALSPAAIAILREAQTPPPSDMTELASFLKALPLRVTALEGLERAISSAGGIAGDQIDDGFQLKALPGIFVAGEMLNWDAPTGGYLLQASFASAAAAAKAMMRTT